MITFDECISGLSHQTDKNIRHYNMGYYPDFSDISLANIVLHEINESSDDMLYDFEEYHIIDEFTFLKKELFINYVNKKENYEEYIFKYRNMIVLYCRQFIP